MSDSKTLQFLGYDATNDLFIYGDDTMKTEHIESQTISLRTYAGNDDYTLAIERAANEGATLCKYADPTEGARERLTVAEAIEIAKIDPTLVYLKRS